ncbi:Uncharacterised protein [Neisseria meningitidis]|nr:Uncharacterised protein [Neisseria meningitidis]
MAQSIHPCGFVAFNRGNGFAKQAVCLGALVFKRGHATCKYGFGNQGQRDTQIEGIDAGPFACTFLTCGIEDFFDQRFAVFISITQNRGGNFNQIRIQFGFVPFVEDLVHFVIRQAQTVFHELVRFANQLHVAVFDAIVHHFDEVARTVAANPVAARLALRRFGGDGLENRFNSRPCGFIAAGHDRRAVTRAFFATGNARADKTDAFCRQLVGAASRIGIVGVAAVNNDVALFQKRNELLDKIVNNRTSAHHHHDFAWFF